jgi:hypothetical protein
VVPAVRRETEDGMSPAARMNCQHFTWKNASSSGRPVVGISRCARCGQAATIADYRKWYVDNESLVQGAGQRDAGGKSE